MSITLAWSTIIPFMLWGICAFRIGSPSPYDRGGYFGGMADVMYGVAHLLNVLWWLLILFAWKYFQTA